MIDGAITTVGRMTCWSATLLDRQPGHRQALHFSGGIHKYPLMTSPLSPVTFDVPLKVTEFPWWM